MRRGLPGAYPIPFQDPRYGSKEGVPPAAGTIRGGPWPPFNGEDPGGNARTEEEPAEEQIPHRYV